MRGQGRLFFALLYKEKEYLKRSVSELENLFGKILSNSKIFNFNSKFYEKEMGDNLKKLFVVFDKKITKDELAFVKKHIANMEKFYSFNDK